ncbi:alpha-glutamyl/putrescinyl thymine pyrophosphorylase clade 3 protein [Halomonas elongata]|uniref:alpha-glutamyl/putrescinyl thymine pyrophosphorylase clade 3 protein n=1 Tax=Halomonas elongata TaxID=2746 RepID=UPI00186BA81E|nr:hypothetical protein [Halomonas elongata]MBW5800036.1 hypothetical protein [Halomonas elongata]
MNRETLEKQLRSGLSALEQQGMQMPGIQPPENRDTLVAQMVDSIRRVDYVSTVRSRQVSKNRTNPHDNAFDPIRAAVWHQQNENNEEASWLIFLAIHFGKALDTEWLLIKDVYGCLGKGLWDWPTVSNDPLALSNWISQNQHILKSDGRKFGNHRKYESLTPGKRGWTGAVIGSYVDWVTEHGSHDDLFNDTINDAGGDPHLAFNKLYHSMDMVKRFGRTGKFDYLTMISKVRIANIIADQAYLRKATGPLRGAKLLFGGSTSANITHVRLEQMLSEIDGVLQVGMQVLEDSLCNWQKTPGRYVQFRG